MIVRLYYHIDEQKYLVHEMLTDRGWNVKEVLEWIDVTEENQKLLEELYYKNEPYIYVDNGQYNIDTENMEVKIFEKPEKIISALIKEKHDSKIVKTITEEYMKLKKDEFIEPSEFLDFYYEKLKHKR